MSIVVFYLGLCVFVLFCFVFLLNCTSIYVCGFAYTSGFKKLSIPLLHMCVYIDVYIYACCVSSASCFDFLRKCCYLSLVFLGMFHFSSLSLCLTIRVWVFFCMCLCYVTSFYKALACLSCATFGTLRAGINTTVILLKDID